ncbi:MAG: hypothetical protein QME94_19975, partial [Anaerolineae bacterium]|nr:hypothetical protein [Anaerolineae bacterium]
MAYTHPLALEARSDLVPAVTDLVRSTLRAVIVVTSGAYLVCCFVAAAVAPERVRPEFYWLAALVLLISAASLWLLTQRLLAAGIVWQAGLAAGIT